MKKILFFACFLSGSYLVNAQVGIGTPTPVTSAMLDIEATDKGILIPRVILTSETAFAPVTGAQAEGLLVYNTGSTITKGFYFWKDQKWNLVIDQINLQESITNIVTGDLGELKNIADYLVPTNPKSGDDTLSHTALVIDPADNTIYKVTYDSVTKKYIRTDIVLKDIIQSLETRTLLKKAEITTDGQAPNFQPTRTAPDPTVTKIGEIYYQYLGEDEKIDYLNLTADVTTIIENNETIKEKITNILNQGGNVYYTDVEVEGVPAKSLYHVDLVTNKKEIIDISTNVFNSITENIENIKKEIGDKITNNVVINTGNQIDGDDVLLYKSTTTITGATTSGVDFTSKLPVGKTRIDRIVAIQLFKDKKFVSDTVTDIALADLKVSFNLGHGNFYLPLPSGQYEVIIEFTSK